MQSLTREVTTLMLPFYVQAWSSRGISINGEPVEDDVPELPQVPPMTRRRLSRLSKMLFAALGEVDTDARYPVIFASRHGDLQRTLKMLQMVATEDALSPTQFALSVHNASAGQYSIFTKNLADSNTIAAGEESLHYAVLEALARLHSEPQLEAVVIAWADDVVPDIYKDFAKDCSDNSVLALKVTRDAGMPMRFAREATSITTTMPNQAAAVARFLASETAELKLESAGNCWCWQRG
ncbi:beta-ketoacyl synthase chain length factor [Aliidiomarina sp. Khilg15.8]